jgi:hypothetical protein
MQEMIAKWSPTQSALLHVAMKHNQSIGYKAPHDLKSRSVGRFCGNKTQDLAKAQRNRIGRKSPFMTGSLRRLLWIASNLDGCFSGPWSITGHSSGPNDRNTGTSGLAGSHVLDAWINGTLRHAQYFI